MLDFESRSNSPAHLMGELETELQNYQFGIEVAFAIPNRMIENWYLADIAYLSKKKIFLKDNLKQKIYEGLDGKQELKKLFKKGTSYSETQHGPQLFILIRDHIAKKNSNSYKHFLEQVTPQFMENKTDDQ